MTEAGLGQQRLPAQRSPDTGTTRIVVTVTFLRQETPPAPTPIALPDGTRLLRVANPTVSLYRYLYNTVGAPWVWWLRRTLPDSDLAALLASPNVHLHVLYRGEEAVGFFELGTALLHAALVTAWSHQPRAVTVNTCTADHPRALPNYRRAGFFVVRTTREVWDVPNRLGLKIPEHLKV
jgi:hypothetical protein